MARPGDLDVGSGHGQAVEPSASPGPHGKGAPPDVVDRARIRASLTAICAFIAAGVGAMLGITYLEYCPVCDSLDALPLLGIVPTWAAAAAVAGGRLAWTRSLGAGVGGSVLLAWLALHFVVDSTVAVYKPAAAAVDAAGWGVGFLGYWLLCTVVMVGAVIGVAHGVDRFVGDAAPR